MYYYFFVIKERNSGEVVGINVVLNEDVFFIV